MSRKRAARVRDILPCVRYGNIVMAKFINLLMFDGKKDVARGIFYDALDKAADRLSQDPVEVFEKVVESARPIIYVRSRRVGGATYQVPTPVAAKRSVYLAIVWLIKAARSRSDKREMSEKLAAEFVDAYSGRGGALKKREETHKMAEANKAFAHFRI